MRPPDPIQVSAYIPSLDGLRAASIALVLLSHFGFHLAPGIFGVTIFFFISGYLITTHILEEIDRTGHLSLPMFYFRRMLRLYPALLVMIFAGGLAFTAVGGDIRGQDALAATFYMANVWEMFGGFQAAMAHPYAVLWSLAVEEHFYLIFPLLTLFVASRRTLLITMLVAAIMLCTFWRWHVAAGCADGLCFFYRVEHGTDTRIDSILFGALLAALLSSPFRKNTIRLVGARPAAFGGVLLILLSLMIRDPWFRQTLRFTVQGFGLMFFVGALLHGSSLDWLRGLLSLRPSLFFGRLSYSIYLWHWVVLCVAFQLLTAPLAAPLLDPAMPPIWWLAEVFLPLSGLSLALAAVSYYGVERPMVQVRRRFGSNAIAESVLAASGPNPARQRRDLAKSGG